MLIGYCVAPLYDAVAVMNDRLLVMDDRKLTEFVASASLLGAREVFVTLFVLASVGLVARLRMDKAGVVKGGNGGNGGDSQSNRKLIC